MPVNPLAKSVSYVQEMCTEKIEIVGVVRRVYYHALYVFWDQDTQTESKEWHYFGTTAAQKPPTTADPVFEHPRVQIPDDLHYLPPVIGDSMLYELAKICGEYREGLVA